MASPETCWSLDTTATNTSRPASLKGIWKPGSWNHLWIAILTGRICLNVAKERGAASTSKQASKKGGT